MKKLLLGITLAAVFVALLSCSKSDSTPVVPPKTYIIVPGAWSGPYAWDSVKSILEKNGSKVIVLQLPGHGADQTAPQTLSMDVYRDFVISAINAAGGKVILVGHSLGGVVISAVAEKLPGKIEKLVYVAGFVPVSGQSLLDLAMTDASSVTGANLHPSADQLTLDVTHDQIINGFIEDGTADEQALLLSHYRIEAAIPFTNKLTLTPASYGSVPKVYIKTLLDHTITPDLQKRMLAATTGFSAVYELNTSHSPFLVKPDSLALLLTTVAK